MKGLDGVRIVITTSINPLTAGAAYIWVFIFVSTVSTTF